MTPAGAGGNWLPVIIAVAPNGAYKTKRDHPRLPETAAEIARTAAECADAGAAMLHLHVRDAAGQHSLDPDAYRRAIEAVRERVGHRLLLQITSEAGGIYSPGQQWESLRDLQPDSVSLALRELAPDGAHESAARDGIRDLTGRGVVPQFILYEPSELGRYRELQARAVIPEMDFPLLFVLGRYTTGQRSQPADLLPWLAEFHGREPWMVCAFGRQENACVLAAATFGGHIRVGFENNLLLKDGAIAAANADLVAQARAGADAIGRPVADAETARAVFRCETLAT